MFLLNVRHDWVEEGQQGRPAFAVPLNGWSQATWSGRWAMGLWESQCLSDTLPLQLTNSITAQADFIINFAQHIVSTLVLLSIFTLMYLHKLSWLLIHPIEQTAHKIKVKLVKLSWILIVGVFFWVWVHTYSFSTHTSVGAFWLKASSLRRRFLAMTFIKVYFPAIHFLLCLTSLGWVEA